VESHNWNGRLKELRVVGHSSRFAVQFLCEARRFFTQSMNRSRRISKLVFKQ
jgi:hypothetical protein